MLRVSLSGRPPPSKRVYTRRWAILGRAASESRRKSSYHCLGLKLSRRIVLMYTATIRDVSHYDTVRS
ncbi:uncharacterized protein B0H18DRAFT_970828 [Fomitopsis serialis]|uniref:uncharacterized protein n=1 Tax=Fomitopsis serialis TaxID=139415 RepID=UPI0020072E2C|nr:uncharacterized protein B0H18DRAFT_978056 [Neoantrodia serialis]XP_047900569.1 uncharacterized protein B0H18DRAFT_970828 [Neoantrodia serialis]KAH9934753.1 hypothetical protein B0H18DRAFT_978056 [Neoantrodia serialis]KAH9937481.1 hypothetical protein B0H18DRAFT_970828 [Neoantrodia serialis]